VRTDSKLESPDIVKMKETKLLAQQWSREDDPNGERHLGSYVTILFVEEWAHSHEEEKEQQ